MVLASLAISLAADLVLVFKGIYTQLAAAVGNSCGRSWGQSDTAFPNQGYIFHDGH